MFKKGQPVWWLQNWDNISTVRIIDAVVHSCGKKEMILSRANGEKFAGRFFKPAVDQLNHGMVLPQVSYDRETAQAMALVVAEEIRNAEIAHLMSCLERNPDASPSYKASISKDLARAEASTPKFIAGEV